MRSFTPYHVFWPFTMKSAFDPSSWIATMWSPVIFIIRQGWPNVTFGPFAGLYGLALGFLLTSTGAGMAANSAGFAPCRFGFIKMMP